MDIRIPNLGDGVSVATVLAVLVSPGDKVEKDQTIIELETDKAVAPIPSELEGVIETVHVKEGDEVSEGRVVLSLKGGASGENGSKTSQNVVVETPPSQVDQAPVGPAPVVMPSALPSTDYKYESKSGFPPPASPYVRKVARELGLDLTIIRGSERGGRISINDLRNFVQRLLTQPAPAPSVVPAKKVSEKVDFSKWGPVSTEKVSSLRKKIGEKMAESWNTIPHVTQFDEADITDLLALRKKYLPAYKKQGAGLTVTVFALKAIVNCLKKHPTFNASYDDAAGELVVKNYYHIGVAVDTENGLIVPVLRDVDKKSIKELSLELAEVAQKAKDRKLSLDQLQGGTFTLSNLGGLGVSHFTPIINSPEVAILGIAQGREKPVIRNKKTEARIIMPIGMSYDHRIIDGADGARFVRSFIDEMEQFSEALVKE
jgi:pyruvate dehydrogenase E2 component (dihydrolipoamide acetyltransferase)